MKTAANRTAKLIECTTTIRLTYDPRSEEFLRTLSDFRESIFKKATVSDVLDQVAFYVLKFGSDRMIEGIGYISVNGKIQGQPFSGIDLESDDFQFDFESKDDYPF